MLESYGAVGFGMVVGWLAHAAVDQKENVNLSWLSAFIGVVGGAAVTGLFRGELFGGYAIGMTVTFFLRMILFSPAARLFDKYPFLQLVVTIVVIFLAMVLIWAIIWHGPAWTPQKQQTTSEIKINRPNQIPQGIAAT